MESSRNKKNDKSIDYALRQLLLDGKAGTHEDICKSLKKQGFNPNQPKVSRLLHKLGAVKVINQAGQNIYRLPHEHGLMHEINIPITKFPFKQLIINIDHNENLIVIHTIPSAASLIARELDLHQLELSILGSIAGDDTIFISPKNSKQIHQVIEKIRLLFNL